LARNVGRMGDMRNAYMICVGKPERNRPLRRPRCREKMVLEWILGT